ncbi:hypothetical protein ABZ281_38545 [Streptomyces sp. NPDC006265]|uniref:hypothetical protein n=1 Tax=Streptomyces sp. NPDC006265 TaxID=3156740 RepID=UPI0033BBAF0D
MLTWDELRARQIWAGLPPCDRAAMYQLLAHADSVRAIRASVASAARELAGGVAQMTRLWEPSSPGQLPHGETAADLLGALDRLPSQWRVLVLGGQREPRCPARVPLDEAVGWALHHASAGLAPPPPVDDWKAESDRKEDERLGAITSERLAKLPYGWQVDAVRRIALGADALGTVAGVALSINVIRIYGVTVRTGTDEAL